MGRFRFNEYKRRGLIPMAGLGLAAYYFFVLVPLKRHAESLDVPLQNAWRRLAASLERTNATSLDFLSITNQLKETRQAVRLLENARQKAGARLMLGDKVRGRMSAPFQLVEYQNERNKQVEELAKLAKQEQVTVDPLVLAGLPEHTVEVKQPDLLWASLALIDGLVTTALHCKVAAIHSLEAPIPFTNAPPVEPSGYVAEIPLEVELTGSLMNVGKLLQSLPLRADEIRTAGLPAASSDKAPLFVDRIVLKKQSPDKPDEVRLFMRVVGYVIRE
jgi:hypothetical protein